MNYPARVLLGSCLFAASGALPALGACLPTAVSYDYPASRLDSALEQFAHTSGCFVHVDMNDVGDLRTDALKGRFTPADALLRLVRGTGLEAHVEQGRYAVNHADRDAVKRRIDALRTTIANERDAGQLSEEKATKLTQQLDAVWQNTQSLIRSQGFLSAAEKASFDRLFAYIQGQLAP